MPVPSLLNSSDFHHNPVLADEVLEAINNVPPELLDGGLMIDATVGGGGHTELILQSHPTMRVIGLDQDPTAREAALQHLLPFRSRVKILNTNFADFTPPEKAVLVLADLGVSSPQLDKAERGFSFKTNGPIDMRMNPERGLTAADLIERVDEKELANIIYKYGEEKRSRKIARRIKSDLSSNGPYSGTAALAYSVAGCFPAKLRHSRLHPATRTFQALRIAVNKELDALDRFLQNAPNWLMPYGLITIISFHSLEDRRVKHSFKDDNRLKCLTRKPLTSSPKEIENNPRSRSAKCRVAIRKIEEA